MIVDADAEQLFIDYLFANLPALGFTVPVASRLDRLGTSPLDRPPESVILLRVGGPRRDLFTDQPQIVVDTRAALESRCVALAGAVRALLNDLPGLSLAGHAVYTVQEFSGPTNQPTDVDPVRYTQAFSIAIRSAVQ